MRRLVKSPKPSRIQGRAFGCSWFSNKKVARELALREGTVKVYLSRIFQKLGAKRRYDLIVQASVEANQHQTPEKNVT
jgi:hypothetical protein